MYSLAARNEVNLPLKAMSKNMQRIFSKRYLILAGCLKSETPQKMCKRVLINFLLEGIFCFNPRITTDTSCRLSCNSLVLFILNPVFNKNGFYIV